MKYSTNSSIYPRLELNFSRYSTTFISPKQRYIKSLPRSLARKNVIVAPKAIPIVENSSDCHGPNTYPAAN